MAPTRLRTSWTRPQDPPLPGLLRDPLPPDVSYASREEVTSEPGSDWRAPAGSGSWRFAAGSCCSWSLRLGGTLPRRTRRAPGRAVRGCRSAAFYAELNPPLLPPGWDRPSAVRGGQRRGGRAQRAGGAAGGARDSVRAGDAGRGSVVWVSWKNEPVASSPALGWFPVARGAVGTLDREERE